MSLEVVMRGLETHPRYFSLVAFARGSLTERERMMVATHLMACDTCSSIARVTVTSAETPASSEEAPGAWSAGQPVMLLEGTVATLLAGGRQSGPREVVETGLGGLPSRHPVAVGAVTVPGPYGTPSSLAWELTVEWSVPDEADLTLAIELIGAEDTRADMVLEVWVGPAVTRATIVDCQARVDIPLSDTDTKAADGSRVRVLLRSAAARAESSTATAAAKNMDESKA